MLFDARRALPQVNQDVLNVADHIREHGWCQGRMFRDEKSCILGAIQRVAGARRMEVKALVRKHIGSVANWNDTRGRTKEQVIAKLEEIGWAD